MNSQTIKVDQFDIESRPAKNQPSQILNILAAIPAQFRIARDIERQARQLYAMNDSALGDIGLDRDSIAAQLVESYKR